MSKIEDLKGKFKNVNELSFNYFVENEFTPTKKYLEFMLKSWSNRLAHGYTKANIVSYVKLFDELLPYIENKDIYSSRYSSFPTLIQTIEEASVKKEEASFVKEDHAFIIKETKTYFLMSPKTYKGSLKYGAGTRWCTASNGNESYFNDYKKGYLVYLIDKTGIRGTNYNKVAFYMGTDADINCGYSIYIANDSNVNTKNMVNAGWTMDEVVEIDLYYRHFIRASQELKTAKREVEKVVNFMKNIDFDNFKKNLNTLKIPLNTDYQEIDSLTKDFAQAFKDFSFKDI